MSADNDCILEKATMRMGAARAAEWYGTVPLPGIGTWTAKDLVEGGRGEEVIEYLKSVDAGVSA